MRPTWDEYFMSIARVVAGRSTCLRRNVGAVIVKDRRILTTGYNGAPMGMRHCLDIGCPRDEARIETGKNHELCRGLHAEQNALIQGALHGISVKDAVVYCTHHPCVLCSKMIIGVGLKAVYYSEPYADPLAVELMEEAGLIVKQMTPRVEDDRH